MGTPDTAELMHAVNVELGQAEKWVGQCLGLLGATMTAWLRIPDARDPLRADRAQLASLVEHIPDLAAAELAIAVDILLDHAPDEVVASWLIDCLHESERLVRDVGHGLRLREMLQIAAEQPPDTPIY